MSFGTFIHTCIVEAKAAATNVVNFLAKTVPLLDKAAPTIEAITAMIDPQAAQAEKAVIALIDEAAAVVQNTAQHNADGSVSLTLNPDIVKQLGQVIADSKDWLGKVGAAKP